MTAITPYAGLTELDQTEQDAVLEAITVPNTVLIIVEDPSSNVWEIQGQEGFELCSDNCFRSCEGVLVSFEKQFG